MSAINILNMHKKPRNIACRVEKSIVVIIMCVKLIKILSMKISEYILLNEYRPKLFYICKYRILKNVPNIIYKNLRRSDCECTTLCNAFFA